MPLYNPFGTPPVFTQPSDPEQFGKLNVWSMDPTVTPAMTPTAGTETVKTVEPSTVMIKKVKNYEEGTSPLLYCTDTLSEYGQESDIPVNHDYWEIKRRIK